MWRTQSNCTKRLCLSLKGANREVLMREKMRLYNKPIELNRVMDCEKKLKMHKGIQRAVPEIETTQQKQRKVQISR